uniref:EF-hand domain-containing protein n=1 Tax=Macrostomum lignano TaxID=282301 RepID=A0A1I8FPW1_9PLAT
RPARVFTVDQQTIQLANSIGAVRAFSLPARRVLRGESKTEEDLQGLNDDPMTDLGFPASQQCLQSIAIILDRDGDGQIDITELMGGIRSYKRKMHRVQEMEKKVPYEETLIGRVNIKLERALEQQRKRQAALKAHLLQAAAAADMAKKSNRVRDNPTVQHQAVGLDRRSRLRISMQQSELPTEITGLGAGRLDNRAQAAQVSSVWRNATARRSRSQPRAITPERVWPRPRQCSTPEPDEPTASRAASGEPHQATKVNRHNLR